MSSNLQRQALGQIASLGALYDSRIPPDTITKDDNHDNHSTNVQLCLSDTFREKFEKMDIAAELTASVLAGLVHVTGSGNYLHDKHGNSHTVQQSLLYRITTSYESLNFSDQKLKSCLILPLLQCGLATHVVVGIEWGAQCVLTARHQLSNETDRTAIEGKFAATFKHLQASLSVQGEARLATNESDLEKSTEFKVEIFGDVIADDGLMPEDLETSLKFIRNLPKYAAAANKGKGKPVKYMLLSVRDLLTSLQIEIVADVAITQLNEECLVGFVQLFDEHRAAQRHLNTYQEFVKNNRHCVPPAHAAAVAERAQRALVAEVALKGKYANLLKEVRSGSSSTAKLWELLKESREGEFSPYQLQDFKDVSKAKVEFAIAFEKLGANYIGYNDKTIDAALLGIRGDAFIFYFNDRVTHDDKHGWQDSLAILHELLTQDHRSHSIFIVDCDATTEKLEKPLLQQWRDGKIIMEDVVKERILLDQKCLARYNEQALDENITQKPLARIVAKISCPNRECPKTPCSWICPKCHAPVEYGHTDDYLYCDCGRSYYKQWDFKCSDKNHGIKFERYNNDSILLQRLKALQPTKEMNILILGETGVGKSTFINAFYNYMLFEKLDDAIRAKGFNWIIPSSFPCQSGQGTDFIEQTIEFGSSSTTECLGSKGESSTQKPVVHSFVIRDTTVRLIDTPGIGDTRGVQQDHLNMANIMATLSGYNHLHGILILLKANSSVLNLTFRFCINELLMHLHRDAANNMVFGFTNTRTAKYAPGTTLVPLRQLLKQHKEVDIPLVPHTMYCFDSEAFRFLAALKQGVDMEDIDVYRISWEKSAISTLRMLKHFESRDAHKIQGTLNLNNTRQLILLLTKPMANITQAIEKTIAQTEEATEQLKTTKLKGEDLLSQLRSSKIVPYTEITAKPYTVCANVACRQFRHDGNGLALNSWKTVCHEDCTLGVERGDGEIAIDEVGHPALKNCWAFFRREPEGRSDSCFVCGHNWKDHMHVMYRTLEKTVVVQDPDVARELELNANDEERIATTVSYKKKLIAAYKSEHSAIKAATTKFSLFLSKNSITTVNDATTAYLDHLIGEEQAKAQMARKNLNKIKAQKPRGLTHKDQQLLGSFAKDYEVATARKDGLEDYRDKHEESVRLLTQKFEGGQTSELLTDKEVEDLIDELYLLEHYGPELKANKTRIQIATESASNRELNHPDPVNKQKSGLLMKMFDKTIGGTYQALTTR